MKLLFWLVQSLFLPSSFFMKKIIFVKTRTKFDSPFSDILKFECRLTLSLLIQLNFLPVQIAVVVVDWVLQTNFDVLVLVLVVELVK